jgi:hypothetical protein
LTLSARERRLLALLGVAAGLVGLRLLWQAASPPASAAGVRAAAAPVLRPAPRASRSRAAEPSALLPLRTDRLDPEPRDFEVGRDLFRFAPPPAPPPPPPPSAAELAERRRLDEERRRLAAEAAERAAVPRPPPVTLRYLGSFGPDGGRIAVFRASDGGEVLNARPGDVLERKFILERIGFESVDLRFVGFPDAPSRRLGIGE